ncbi:aminotransferase class V-fold PLP-dependent enzyme [Lichenibacterium minor]|uniref:Cysteine desulfurase n=1 Tax=Lichenibacterium minor TaxID=2316528 RepID=A0A4Q2U9L8_9HYPH|nr:aminotransferase class V-fold PLP-dependent enzyme [Lichenibacterium minor]RYC31716.1 aminotransferase class V-fold PLP-dependent enzyme [Lichenibacterium minor]
MTRQPARPRVYLDHNATAPLRPEARAAALSALECAANPSSVHAEGRRARAVVERARAEVAALVGARTDGVTFTSGATEAAALALTPDLVADGRGGFERLLVSATEHAAVLKGHRFPAKAVTVLPVAADGTLDPEALGRALAEGGRALVAVQAANNETGVLQDVPRIAALARARGGALVCDAVQAAGRINCRALGADILLLSAHKLGGLAGAGALVVASGRVAPGSAVLRGGGQERGLRSGTENVPAIAAFGAACAAARAATPDLAALRDRFEAALFAVAPDAAVAGQGAARLPNTCAFAVPGVSAERLLMALDLDGVAVSSGSACASGKVGRSHVLDAMKVNASFTSGAIRVSFGWDSAEADVDRATHALGTALHRMRGGRNRTAA